MPSPTRTPSPVLDDSKPSLFDIDGEYLNPHWVDPKQDLFIPNTPLHYKAHRLQVLLAILDKQAIKLPGQFSSKNYLDVLENYISTIEKIKAPEVTADDDNDDDQGNLADAGRPDTAPTMGEGIAPSVGTGISADNPLTR